MQFSTKCKTVISAAWTQSHACSFVGLLFHSVSRVVSTVHDTIHGISVSNKQYCQSDRNEILIHQSFHYFALLWSLKSFLSGNIDISFILSIESVSWADHYQGSPDTEPSVHLIWSLASYFCIPINITHLYHGPFCSLFEPIKSTFV